MNMKPSRYKAGFTMIELMIVMAVIAILLTVAYPKYIHSIQRSKEAVLKHDLAVMREAIDKFKGDWGRYPISLDELVKKKYLRKIPIDPITEDNKTWQSVSPDEGSVFAIYDVKSGAEGKAEDGSFYNDW